MHTIDEKLKLRDYLHCLERLIYIKDNIHNYDTSIFKAFSICSFLKFPIQDYPELMKHKPARLQDIEANRYYWFNFKIESGFEMRIYILKEAIKEIKDKLNKP